MQGRQQQTGLGLFFGPAPTGGQVQEKLIPADIVNQAWDPQAFRRGVIPVVTRQSNVIRDRSLVNTNNVQEQSFVASYLSQDNQKEVLDSISAAGIDEVWKQGMIYKIGKLPIDSKGVRKQLNDLQWYKSPANVIQYKAKAAIRFAQQWNKMIRNANKTSKVFMYPQQSFEQVLRTRRAQLQLTPDEKLFRKTQAFLKKYNATTIGEAMQKRQRAVTKFRNKQQNMLAQTEDIYGNLAQGNLGLALAGYEDYLNNDFNKSIMDGSMVDDDETNPV